MDGQEGGPDKRYELPIDEIRLSVRSNNALESLGITTLGLLTKLTAHELAEKLKGLPPSDSWSPEYVRFVMKDVESTLDEEHGLGLKKE